MTPTRRWTRTWRDSTGVAGTMVEIIVWIAVVTAALNALTLLLRATAWLLERAA